MRISSTIRILKLSAVPLLFSAATGGLLVVEAAFHRRAEATKTLPAQAASQEALFSAKILGLKFRELAAAAERGDLVARVEMGRRFALGQGVRKDEARAAGYFQSVIDEFGEIGARDKRGPLVAAAYRHLAEFYRSGAAGAKIAPNSVYAFSLLHHAASYFADPAAQFELAKILMRGEGVTKNGRVAAQWLLNASRKGYAPAQALLGELLWRGEGVKRVAGDGLGLLAIARRNASAEDRAWISKLFETARAQALPIEILEANAFIVQEMSVSRFGRVSDIQINGDNESTSGIEAQTDSSSAQSASRQSTLVHGPSEALSELKANPMALIPDAVEPQFAVEKKDPKTTAGMFHMYQPQSMEVQVEAGPPVLYAGVTK
jgi:uncharacterized protein